MAHADRANRAAPVHHGRQRGRRQVDPHRTPAVRFQGRLRRPAGLGAQGDAQPVHQRAGPVAADRRAAGRARTRHYDRRRVPLFCDSQKKVHHRRHAGARAVHAQHGDRRFDGEPRGDSDRRPLWGFAAIAPARVHRDAAGIPHLLVAVNKMDLVDFREDVFHQIRQDFAAFAAQLHAREVQYVPISALLGDNVVERSGRTPWYTGPSLLEHLETVHIDRDINLAEFRFPVQYVIRPNLDFRGFAGQIASGVLRRGDEIAVLPSGRTSRVKSIVTYDGELEEAFAPMSVTVCLEDEIDISRGDMLVHPAARPHSGRRFEATVVWMNQKPLEEHRPYLLKHTTQMVQARVREIRHRVDVNTLGHERASRLQLNEIGVVSVEAQRPVFFDAYRKNRATGSFILIDPITNETLGAGMIARPDIHRHSGPVSGAERLARIGHRPYVIRLQGGDADTARLLERHLFDLGYLAHVLEGAEHAGEAVRTLFQAGLVSIVYGPAAEQSGSLPAGLPPEQVLLLDRSQYEDEADLLEAAVARLASGNAGNVQLTDGGGI